MSMRGLGFNVGREEVARIIRRYEHVSSEGEPLMSRRDFLALMAERYRTRDPREEMRRAFNLFDRDNKGRVT